MRLLLGFTSISLRFGCMFAHTHTYMQTHSCAHTHAYNGSVCSSSNSNSRNMYVMYTIITVAVAADVLFLFFM